MNLSVIGLSHKTAPLPVRERLAFAPQDTAAALRALRGGAGARECLLLSTCNRTEAYLVTDSSPSIEEVTAALCGLRGVQAGQVRPWLAVATETDAARHLLRVAAGLESMVVGEPQILRQVRRALEIAQCASATGPVLTRLTQVAIATGRRVRRETGLSLRARSVPREALEVCRRAAGSVRNRRVVVVGAGEMGELVVKAFSAAGASIIAVANRSLEPARLLAARVGATATTLEEIPAALRRADIVVVTVGASPPVISGSAVTPRVTPLYLIDLGVPRSVDPAVAHLPGVFLHNLDALGSASSAVPDHIVREAERIVEEALTAFWHWLQARSAAPLIAALRRHAARIADEEITRARLGGLDLRQREAVRATVQAAMARLLHVPTVRLKAGAGDGRLVALAAELFGLDGEEGDR